MNERLKVTASEYPNVTLVDWYVASAGKKDYFAPDGVHLTKVGAEAYANTCSQSSEVIMKYVLLIFGSTTSLLS